MSYSRRLPVGAGLFVLLGAIAVHSPWFGASALQELLKARAEGSLQRADMLLTWPELRIEMSGQVARIHGVYPSLEDRQRARLLVLESTGPGGTLMGGVTRVIDETGPYERVEAYRVTAEKDPQGVVITGFAPDADARDRVAVGAAEIFPDFLPVEGELTIADGAPVDVRWGRAATYGLRALNRLDRGRFTLDGPRRRLLIEGVAVLEADAAALRALAGEPPEGIDVVLRVTGGRGGGVVIPAPTPEAPADEVSGRRAGDALSEAAAAELAALDEGAAAPDATASPRSDVCQEMFDQLMARNAILFDTAQATIRPESYDLLDTLARAARRCRGFEIRIAGHTDSTGDSAMNQRLSEARALAVKTYLERSGVGLDRLAAVGYGEDRPIADNATGAGRTRNRRIEFEILR